MLPTCLDLPQWTLATMQLRRVLCTSMSRCLRFIFSFFLFLKQTLWRVEEVEIRQETFQICSLTSLFCCQRTIPPASFEKEKKSYHIKCNWITIKQQRTNSFHFSRQRSEKKSRFVTDESQRRDSCPPFFLLLESTILIPVQIKKWEWAAKRPRPPVRLGTE